MSLFSALGDFHTDFSHLDDFMLPLVTEENNIELTAIPSEEEIHDAVFRLDEINSPSRDDFVGIFYRVCWNIIYVDIVVAVQFFFTTMVILHRINVKFVALIPKTHDAEQDQDFRPIVMENFNFKIFTKVLATQLGRFFGFVTGRRIHSCIALTSDVISCFESRGAPNMAIKVDMIKAVDSISWEFLKVVLVKLGFSN
ncbi:hypothetical protein ACS0TY_021910 [Phlomoides rotata]